MAMATTTVQAAHETAQAAAPHAAHGSAHAQEQLFNLAMLESTLFWTGLAFVILLTVVWKYVTPVMRDTLDKRAARIQDDIDRAARLRNEAQQALSEYESQLQTARKEAHEIVAKAKDEAEKLMTTKTTMLERDLARRSEDARVSIEQAKSKALREIRAEVAELALAAAERILHSQVDAKKAAQITDEVLKELNH